MVLSSGARDIGRTTAADRSFGNGVVFGTFLDVLALNEYAAASLLAGNLVTATQPVQRFA